MLANRLSTASLKLSGSTILLLGLYFSVFQGERAPAQDKNPPAQAADKGKERRFDSPLSLLVFQIVDDRTQPRFLGVTPTPSKKGIVVPDDDARWFVVPAQETLGPAAAQAKLPPNVPNNPNLPKVPRQPRVIRLGIIGGGIGLIGGGLGLGGGMLPGKNQIGGLNQLGGMNQLGQLPNLPGLDPSKLPAGFAGLPPGFGGNLPPGFRGGFPPSDPPGNFNGNPGGAAIPGGFGGGNIIPPKGAPAAPEKPAPEKEKEKKKVPEIINADVSFVSDDAPVQVAQLGGVGGAIGGLKPKFDVKPINPANPVNPGVHPATPAGKKQPVTEAKFEEFVAELKKNNIPGVCLENVDVKDADLAILAGWSGVKTLILRNTSVTDDGLQSLGKFPALRHLVLDGDFTAKGLAHLKDRSLNILELSGKHVGNDCIEPLQDLKDLKVLRLRWTKINDAGIKTLVGLKNLQGLETIELCGQNVTDTGIAYLAELPGLRRVRLYLTRCTDAGLEALTRIANLSALTVDSCSDGLVIPFATVRDGNIVVRGVPTNLFGVFQRAANYSGSGNNIRLASPEGAILVPTGKITNDGFAHFKAMKSLKELEVTNWNIGDIGLESLQTVANLTSLKLDSPSITNRGLASLKDLTRLETLDLRCSQISGHGAKHLAKLTSLKTMYVALTCTDDDVAAYREALPAGTAISRGNPYDELNQALGKIAPSK